MMTCNSLICLAQRKRKRERKRLKRPRPKWQQLTANLLDNNVSTYTRVLTHLVDFDLNRVEGHEEYKYIELFERIENIMAEKNKLIDEEEKDLRGEDPKTRPLGSTKTQWANFYLISQEINREP